MSVRVSISQPSESLPSQFSKPALQTPMPQTLALQRGVLFAGAQVFPQPPQFARLVRTSISHPLAELPSQFEKFGSHVSAQAPVTHCAAACGRVMHVVPHAPQFSGSLIVAVSHPLAGLASQS